MLSQQNIGALIGRLEEHVLANAPGTMSETQVIAALALLDRTVPDLHQIVLNDGRPEVVLEAAPTHSLVEA